MRPEGAVATVDRTEIRREPVDQHEPVNASIENPIDPEIAETTAEALAGFMIEDAE